MSTERGPPRRIFQSIGRFTREAKLRRREANKTETSQFLAEIERLMDAKGIDDLEELHERCMKQLPERIGNARQTSEHFRQHAAHEAKALHVKFMVLLVGALEATDEEKEKLFLAWVEDASDPRRPAYTEVQGQGYPYGRPRPIVDICSTSRP